MELLGPHKTPTLLFFGKKIIILALTGGAITLRDTILTPYLTLTWPNQSKISIRNNKKKISPIIFNFHRKKEGCVVAKQYTGYRRIVIFLFSAP